MPGNAITNEFMIGTATVMIGSQADLFDLNPAEHSIGLVKNFTATSEPSYTELTQGVKNTIVYSVMTANPVRCTMEVYEYNAANLAYALGLDGSGLTTQTITTRVNGAVSGGSPADLELTVDSVTGISTGKYIMIINDADDDFVVRRVVSVSGMNVTVDKGLPAILDNAEVKVVNAVDIGSKTEQPFLSAKVAAKLANGEEMVFLFPKIRIVRGFNVAFTSDDFGNLPFEFTVYDLVSTDAFYNDFGGAQGKVFRT